MKLGSLFDGIGGFPLSGTKYGLEPVWASEIEPFPVKVTQKHFLDMEHLGDITKINGAEIEPVEVITFGSPCQDLSVAGKREGMSFLCNSCGHSWEYSTTYGIDQCCPECNSDDVNSTRSGLFSHAIRIIREMREATNGQYPRFAVWENVSGAYSSNRGQDFRAVLAELSDTEIPMPVSGGWAGAGLVRTNRVEIAWRTLDAQYWGVPQRRKRIFLVADFRGQCAGEILFVEPRLSGHPAESGSEGQEAAGDVGTSVTESSYGIELGAATRDMGNRIWKELTHSLRASVNDNMPPCVIRTVFTSYWDGGQISDCLDCSMLAKGQMMPEKRRFPAVLEPQLYDMTHADEVMRPVEKGIAPTLNSRMGTGGNQVPVMLDKEPQVVAFGIGSYESNSMKSSNPYSGIYKADTARTLDLNGGNPACNQGGIAICLQGSMIGRADKNGPQGDGVNEEVSFTLNTTDRHAVAYGIDQQGGKGQPCVIAFAANQRDEVRDLNDKAGALQAEPGMKQQTFIAYGIDQQGGKGQANYGVDVMPPLCSDSHGTPHAVAYEPYQKVVGALCADDHKGMQAQMGMQDKYIVYPTYAVRRLTPTECLRLQGFPDWWLDIEGASDTAKYKSIGNSLAIPCVDFVMSGIARVLRRSTNANRL